MNGGQMARGSDERLYGQLAKLADDRSRRRFLARHSRLFRPEVVARIDDLATQKVKVDAREALALAEAAELIARRLRSTEALAHGLRAKGNALYGLNDHKAAVAHHARAAQLFGKAGKPTEVGRTLSTSIQPLILLGEYQQAQSAAARAREIFTSQGDGLRLARLELNVGNIYHRQDRFAEALHCYEQAYERLVAHRNVEGVAVALGNMAMCLISLNDFTRALETHHRARAFCEEHALPTLVRLADYNIAYLHYFRGQYGRAIEALKATRDACRTAADAYVKALCPLDLAEIYLELNLSEDAAAMAEEALEGFRQLRMGYETAKALSFLAIAHGQQGKVLRALELFAEARALFVGEDNSVWPALLDLYQGVILFNAGRLFESRRYCQAALAVFAASPLRSKAALCRLVLCRIALRMGDLAAARAESERAAEGVSALDIPALRFQVHYVQGQIEQADGRPAEAYASYRAAQGFLEALRSSLRGEELKIAFMKTKLDVYEGLAELALGRGGDGAGEEAFSYAEHAKSRTLQELILRAPAPMALASGGKSALVRRVGELREELNWYYHRIEAEQMAPEERTAERLERLQGQVQAHENELLRVLREMPESEREPFDPLVPASLPLHAVRAALPADAVLIEYFRVGERLLAFVVGRDTFAVVPVALVPRVQHLLRLLQFQLSWARPGAAAATRGSRQALLSATQSHLAELYQELVAPLRAQLAAAEHLIFVPHDLLHYVPFHALYDGREHLIDAYSVSYAPSATIYALCHARKTNRTGPSLVLGVPEPQTPFIRDEVHAVAARLPDPELFVGGEASAGVLREKGPGSRFVHIAAHGFFRSDNPMFSGIRLGDSYLTLYDLYGLELPAELVALSGCVTGMSVIAAGDELLGLARGLFRAGAASLLLALWEVPDESTAEFMKAFYDRLLGARHRGAALRQAIRDVRERYPHPLHWAPFVLSGKVIAE